MDTKVFHYFTELARVKNYSRAAKTLYISPQGLSSSIKRLEGQLGVSLIEADGKGVKLTEYGEIFRKYAQDLSMEVDGMEREIDDLRRHNSGSLKFAVSIGLFNVFPRAAIDDFNDNADTTARIESVKTMLDDDCEQSLFDKTIDFALLNDPIDHSVFSSIPLHKDMMFLWMKKDDELAAKDFLTMDDLMGKTISCLASREFKTSRELSRFWRNLPIIAPFFIPMRSWRPSKLRCTITPTPLPYARMHRHFTMKDTSVFPYAISLGALVLRGERIEP